MITPANEMRRIMESVKLDESAAKNLVKATKSRKGRSQYEAGPYWVLFYENHFKDTETGDQDWQNTIKTHGFINKERQETISSDDSTVKYNHEDGSYVMARGSRNGGFFSVSIHPPKQ